MIKMVLTPKESVKYMKDKSFKEDCIQVAHDYAIRSEEHVALYVTDTAGESKVYSTDEI